MTAPAETIHEEEALDKSCDAQLMRRLLRYVRPYMGLVVGALLLLSIEGVLQLVGPFLTRQVIDVAIPAGDRDRDVDCGLAAGHGRIRCHPVRADRLATLPEDGARVVRQRAGGGSSSRSQDLSEKYNIIQSAMASSERVFKLLDTFAHTATGRAEDRGGEEPEWVLKGVSFTASPGKTTALVGHTGAGKTTIANLLLRFYDPQRGRILLNGTDIRDLPLAELRGVIGYVQQEIFLFAGDIATNIRLANPLDEAAVVSAARQVGADPSVRRLPGGYSHVLGERGASIRVGERQLLSFARAIAADPPLLLLDEATSAVESEIEGDIQRALGVLQAGRTTIAVAHRLSTIVSADEILVLHHGEVVERGTHDGLVRKGGIYERLWRLQLGEGEALTPSAGNRLPPVGADR